LDWQLSDFDKVDGLGEQLVLDWEIGIMDLLCGLIFAFALLVLNHWISLFGEDW